MNTGKPNLITSVSATLAGMGLNDIAQLIAFIVAIVSGLMAMRHYWVGTKLTQLKIKKLEKNDHEAKTESHH